MGKVEKDLKILLKFIEAYCQCHHHAQKEVWLEGNKWQLCSECEELGTYAVKRRLNCPKNPKPSCKNCDIHCYAPKYRDKIRKIMKFSGIYFIKRGRLDYLWHYLT